MFSLSFSARAFAGLGFVACTACVGVAPGPDSTKAPRTFYTVTAEIALTRHEPRVAALEYAAVAEGEHDEGLLRRATEVTADCLQPSLTADVATRWIAVNPTDVDAHRAAARAALELHEIDQAAAQYRVVLISSPRGTEAEFAVIEIELTSAGNVYGARQVADRLALYFPGSASALRLQAFAALRGDDPAAAVRAFQAALAALGSEQPAAGAAGSDGEARSKSGAGAEGGAATRTGEAGAGGGAATSAGKAEAGGRPGSRTGEARAASGAGTGGGAATSVGEAGYAGGAASRAGEAAAPGRARAGGAAATSAGEAVAGGGRASKAGEASSESGAGAGGGAVTSADEAGAGGGAATSVGEAGAGAVAAGAAAGGVTSVKRERRELTEGLWRAQVLAGDVDQPLADAKAVAEHDDTAENRMEYAMVLLSAQRNDEARAQLTALTHSKEARPMALRMLGLVEFQDGKLDEASARFAELVTTGRYLDDGLYYLGLIAERHEDLERALRLYAQVQSGDNALVALLRAATILETHGAAPAAEDLLDQLLIDEPQRVPEILAARARIYADSGDIPKGMAVLDQGELEYPDSVELRYARASMAEEAGHLSASLKELKEVVELRPADPAALNAYGYTLADHNRHLRAARKLIEEAHMAAPKSAAILDSLGWVLYRQGHGADALTYLHEAYADDRGGDIAAHLGEVLWQQGQRDEAEHVWTEAGRTDTDNALLKATRQRLHAAN